MAALPHTTYRVDVTMKLFLLSALHPVRKVYWRIFRPRTRGVKVALRHPASGNILLVRHTYGSDSWMLPGGAIERGETPEQAATREVWEELRIRLNGTSFFASYENHHEGKRDSVYLFLAHSDATPEPSPLEIKECRFVPLASLPDQVSPATLRRLDDIARGAPMSEQW